MDKLPKVFASPIDKEIRNYQETYESKREIRSTNIKDINKKINEIFASLNHVYKSRVRITYNGDTHEEVIVGKTNTHLLTMDKKLIKITDITDIERI